MTKGIHNMATGTLPLPQKRKRGRPTREEAAARRAQEQTQNMQQQTSDFLWNIFDTGATAAIEKFLQEKTDVALGGVMQHIEEIREQVEGQKQLVVVRDGVEHRVAGKSHKSLGNLIKVSQLKRPIMMVGPAGGGKALSLDTPIATPEGWTTMGEIRIGDRVFDENGNSCGVTYLREHATDDVQYRVTFSDGAYIDASSDHLWVSHSDSYRASHRAYQKNLLNENYRPTQRNKALSPQLLTTQEMKDTLYLRKRVNHAIPVAKPLTGNEKVLPIHPYVLGAWLGDGFSSTGKVCGTDPHIFEKLAEHEVISGDETKKGVRYVRCQGLTTRLAQLSLLNNKHIPQMYLRASYGQRLELLHGLMDTDGSIEAKHSKCEITQKNLAVIEDIAELLNSLGMKCAIRPKTAQAQTGEAREVYRITFRPIAQVFSLPRKAVKLNKKYRETQRYRYVVSIEPIEKTLMTCIRVDSPSHLFLAGKSMIPTHNTYAVEQMATALDRSFYSISVGLQTSKADFLGYMDANGRYVSSAFRWAYEHGGVFLTDEIDAGNANVLVILNSALSGSAFAFPDGIVKAHKDFLFVATANTYGNGASRQYVGRNQLDSATLDRFIVLDWEYDTSLEYALIAHMSHADRWMAVIRELRLVIQNRGLRVIVSPRSTIQGCELLELGFSLNEVLDMRILSTAPVDARQTLLDAAKGAW